jgi:hypothetical protein
MSWKLNARRADTASATHGPIQAAHDPVLIAVVEVTSCSPLGHEIAHGLDPRHGETHACDPDRMGVSMKQVHE